MGRLNNWLTISNNICKAVGCDVAFAMWSCVQTLVEQGQRVFCSPWMYSAAVRFNFGETYCYNLFKSDMFLEDSFMSSSRKHLPSSHRLWCSNGPLQGVGWRMMIQPSTWHLLTHDSASPSEENHRALVVAIWIPLRRKVKVEVSILSTHSSKRLTPCLGDRSTALPSASHVITSHPISIPRQISTQSIS